jgi:hypothetical protein
MTIKGWIWYQGISVGILAWAMPNTVWVLEALIQSRDGKFGVTNLA